MLLLFLCVCVCSRALVCVRQGKIENYTKWLNTFKKKKKKKTQHVYHPTSGRENGAVPKLSWLIIAETDSDVVNYPTVENKHRMFDRRLPNVVNPEHIFPFGGTMDSVLTNIRCMSWAAKMAGPRSALWICEWRRLVNKQPV